MTTLSYRGIDYNVVLIDPSIETGGDGASTASALKDFPTVLENNTCYLIRRTNIEDGYCFIPYQTTDVLVNVMFLGMPKSTDPQWIQDLVIDSSINTAWKADTASYACIKFPHYGDRDSSDSANAVVNSANLEYCIGINLYCFRQDADRYNYYTWYDITAMFSNRYNTDWKTRFNFYQCKFGVLNYNIDSDSYLASNEYETIRGSENTQWYNEYGANYVCARNARELILKDCIFNASGNGQANRWGTNVFETNAVKFYEIKDARIEDCVVHGIPGNSSTNNSSVFCIAYIEGNVIVKNIQYNQILHNTRLLPLLAIGNRGHIGSTEISNITINFKRFMSPVNIDSTLYSTDSSSGGILTGTEYYSPDQSGQFFSIENFTVNADIGSVKLAEGNFLELHIRGDTFGLPNPPYLKNINIHLHDKLDECFLTKIGTNPSTANIDAYWWSNTSGNNESSAYSKISNKPSMLRLENLSIKSSLTGYLRLVGVMTNIDKLDAHLLAVNSQVQVNTLDYSKHENCAVRLQGGNTYVRVKNLIVPEDRASDEPVVVDLYNGGQINVYIDNCNNENVFPTAMDNNTDVSYYYSNAICCNAGDSGKFIQRNRNVIAQSWSVTRSGSESSASLKLQNNTTASASPLVVCPRPFKAFEVTPTETGVQTLVAYFAYRNFVPENETLGKHRFNLEVDVPYEKSDHTYGYTTYSSNDWFEDDSTWSDPDAVARKIILPIDIKCLRPIDVRVVYHWYSNNGFVYFDPDIRLI